MPFDDERLHALRAAFPAPALGHIGQPMARGPGFDLSGVALGVFTGALAAEKGDYGVEPHTTLDN
jgi:hypothetical protein